MNRLVSYSRILALLVVLLPGGSPAVNAALPSTGLVGTVKSSDGKPLEGVAVSAKGRESTITTSVYTNQNGEYYFPPLPNGQYRVWAQAVGFELTRAEQTVVFGQKDPARLHTEALQRQLEAALGCGLVCELA